MYSHSGSECAWKWKVILLHSQKFQDKRLTIRLFKVISRTLVRGVGEVYSSAEMQ